MPVGSVASCIILAVSLFSLHAIAQDISPVVVWIESPKQNEKIYYYNQENPTFNATIRLHRQLGNAVGSLSLNVFFQGAIVAEVAAESDTVSRFLYIDRMQIQRCFANVCTSGFAVFSCIRRQRNS